MRIEPAIECGEIAAELDQFIELGKYRITAEHITVRLAGKPIESAVVALRHTYVRVVDDPHDHVCTAARRVKARADVRSEISQDAICGI